MVITHKLEAELGRLHAVLADGSYSYDDEHQLQDLLEARLQQAGLRYQREHRLRSARGEVYGRCDFVVGASPNWIAIEVKVAGSRGDLLQQVDRYLRSGRVAACLVATTRNTHRDLPRELRGKPLRVSWLSTGAAFGGATDQAAPAPRVGQLVRTTSGWAVNLEAHAMGRFKRLFPRVAGRQHGTILLDDRRETCRDLVWYCSRFPLQMTELDRAHLHTQAEKYDRQRARLAAVVNGTFRPREFTMALPPRPYQQRGAEVALQAGGLLLADVLGLGKTVTAIAALTDPSTRPALVVTQTHLAKQWQEELKRFAPTLRTHVIRRGTPYDVCRPPRGRKLRDDSFHVPQDGSDRPFPDVLITTYSKLAGWADVLAPVMQGVVWDEVQDLRRGEDTQKGAAAALIADNAHGLRLGLSATPIYNYGDEMHSVMRVLKPGALGTQDEFRQEWCTGYGSNYRVTNPDALGSWLRSEGLMLRRTRRDVGRELPPLHNVPVLVEADLDALGAVEREVADLARALLADTTPVLERGRAAREMDTRLRQATGIAKAPHVAAFVRALFADGRQKVVLAGWHRAVYAIWQDLLAEYNPVMFTGSESPAGKRAAVEAFTDGDSRLLLISLRSGAGLDGLQYTDCQDLVYGELDWSPEVHAQLSGRLDRDGQEESVTAWYLHADGGSDPTIMDVLGVKRAQSVGILDPTGANPEPKADPSHAKALARRLLGMSS